VFELPADLSALSRDELSALLSEYEQAFDELAESASTAEDVATLTAGAEAIEAVRGEMDSRPSEAAMLAALRTRVFGEEGEPAQTGRTPARRARPALSAMRNNRPNSRAPRPSRSTAGGRIVSANGQVLDHAGLIAQLTDAVQRFGRSDDSFLPVARVETDLPDDRTLRQAASAADNMAVVAAALDQLTGLTAAGGLCGPLAPYHEMLVIADAGRPVRDFLPNFGAERGGITLIPPPNLADLAASVSYKTASQDRESYTDWVSTNASTAYTSASATFTAEDVPLHLGAPDMAFPRLNALSYWLFLGGGLTMLAGFLTSKGAAAFGWTAYTPLSDAVRSPGAGADLWIVALIVTGLSSILTAVNLITTVISLRAPGMTMFRWPRLRPVPVEPAPQSAVSTLPTEAA
jgi:Cytochrome C and Quinol oxidase polypeptide I